MSEITSTQARYLSFIHAYTEGFGQPPSMSEIAEGLKVSVPSVNGMLKSLEKKGFIERKTGVARSIDILIDRAQIPRWTKKIAATFTFWAPNNASQEMLDEIAEKVIAARKAT